ncbi:uncharacterized protein LOC144440960 [Glandiceps talaboti]
MTSRPVEPASLTLQAVTWQFSVNTTIKMITKVFILVVFAGMVLSKPTLDHEIQERARLSAGVSCYKCVTAFNPKEECVQETMACRGRTSKCYYRGLKSKNGHMVFLKGCMAQASCERYKTTNPDGCSLDMNPDTLKADDKCFYCFEGSLSNDQDKEVLPVDCYKCDWTTDPSQCEETITCAKTGDICAFKARYSKAKKSMEYWKGCLWRTTCNTVSNLNSDTCPAADAFTGLTTAGRCTYCTEGSLSNSQPIPEPTEVPPEPIEVPPEPTEAPPEPTEAPPEPTEAPPEPTEAPPEPTEAPIIVIEAADETLSCFTCSQVTNAMSDCTTETEVCSDGEVCYFKAKRRNSGDIYYSKGCIGKSTCEEKAAKSADSCGNIGTIQPGDECFSCSDASLSNNQAPPALIDNIINCFVCDKSTTPLEDCTTKTEECPSNNVCYFKAKKKSNGDTLYSKGCMGKENCIKKQDDNALSCGIGLTTMEGGDECVACSYTSLSNNQQPGFVPPSTTQAPAVREGVITASCYVCDQSKELADCTKDTEDCNSDSVCYLKMKKKSNGKLEYSKGCVNSARCSEKEAGNSDSCSGMNPDNVERGDECYCCSSGTLSNTQASGNTAGPCG